MDSPKRVLRSGHASSSNKRQSDVSDSAPNSPKRKRQCTVVSPSSPSPPPLPETSDFTPVTIKEEPFEFLDPSITIKTEPTEEEIYPRHFLDPKLENFAPPSHLPENSQEREDNAVENSYTVVSDLEEITTEIYTPKIDSEIESNPPTECHYKCNMCHFTFLTFQMLCDHLDLVHALVHICICKRKFQKITELKSHAKEIHNVCAEVEPYLKSQLLKTPIVVEIKVQSVPVTCIACKEDFTDLNNFKSHWIMEHTNFCRACGILFPNSTYFENHLKLHNMGKILKFKCTQCFLEFKSLLAIKCHVMTHGEIINDDYSGKFHIYHVKSFENYKPGQDCPLCTYVIAKSYSIEKHLSEHIMLKCQGCQSHFIKLNFYVETNGVCSVCALENRAPPPLKTVTVKKIEGHFPCIFCDVTLSCTKGLSEHLTSHNMCVLCTSEFKTEAELAAHKKSHARKTINFARCQICKTRFRTSKELEIHHRKFHRGEKFNLEFVSCIPTINLENVEKKTQCLYCNAEDISNLSEHLYAAHNIRSCRDCRCKFLKKEDKEKKCTKCAQNVDSTEDTSVGSEGLDSFGEHFLFPLEQESNLHHSLPAPSIASKDSLLNIQTEPDEITYTCLICNSHSDSHINFFNHMRKTHTNVCFDCGYFFKDNATFQKHLKRHFNGKIYSYVHKNKYDSFISTRLDEVRSTLGRNFASFCYKKKHFSIRNDPFNDEEEVVMCPMCLQEFPDCHSLQIHLKNHAIKLCKKCRISYISEKQTAEFCEICDYERCVKNNVGMLDFDVEMYKLLIQLKKDSNYTELKYKENKLWAKCKGEKGRFINNPWSNLTPVCPVHEFQCDNISEVCLNSR